MTTRQTPTPLSGTLPGSGSVIGLLAVGLAMASTACGVREPGPLEAEFGEVLYWRLTEQIEISWDHCTDGLDRDQVQPPPYQENMFLVYRVSEDGTQAVAQDCVSTSPSSCQDHALGIVFDVSDHTLNWDPEMKLKEGTTSTCTLGTDELWQVFDDGDTGTFEASSTVRLVGDPEDCAELDRFFVEGGTNEFGLDGCVMTLRAELDHYPTDFPIIRAVTGQR